MGAEAHTDMCFAGLLACGHTDADTDTPRW